MSKRFGDVAERSGRCPLNSGRWQLQLLGGLHARSGDHEISFPDRATTLLLARLALEPHSVHSRRDLEAMLDDKKASSPAQRSKRLNNALSVLRGLLRLPGAPGALLKEGAGVRLNAEMFDIDVECFRDCIMRRDVAGARSWYRGELLPGYRLEWLDIARDKLTEWHDGLDVWHDPEPPADDLDARPAAPKAQPGPAAWRDGLFGREDELERLHRLLDTSRVVTITGPPGCGKSRLAKALRYRWGGRKVVIAAALADVDDAAAIADALRAAVPLPACGTQAIRQLATALAGERALLILDDVEHLVGAAADAQIDELLHALPDAQLLLTSRRALRRRDESEFPIGPLPIPQPDADLASASANPAVALFVHCARTVRASFHLHRRNVNGVVRICRAVDGLPFALELIAPQLRQRSSDEIAELLTGRLQTLERRAVNSRGSSRHASVQAALAGSWRLLDADGRIGLQALTTFRGGCSETQAGAVVGARAREVLDALARDSLVQRSADVAAPARWQLLRIVRDFTFEQMSAVTAAGLRQNHRLHFLQMAQDLATRFQRAADADMPNFTRAMDSALTDGDFEVATGIAVGLESHWQACGVSNQQMQLLERVAATPIGDQPARHVALHAAIARACALAGRRDAAVAAASRGTAAARGSAQCTAEALLVETHVRWLFDRAAAAAVPARSVADQAQRFGWPALRARALLFLGAMTLENDGEPERAARFFEEAERLFAEQGDQRASLLALPGRTACSLAQRSFQTTIAVATAGAERARRAGDVVTQLLLLCRVALCREGLRQFDQALLVGQQQARLARSHGLGYHLIYGAWNQCRPLARLRRPVTALQLLAFTCGWCEREKMLLDDADRRYVRRVRQLSAQQLDPIEADEHWHAGSALTLAQGIELACGNQGKSVY